MDDSFRLYHVAKLYYVDGFKQADIAEMMNLSVMSISRLLKAAEEEGIVRVEVRAAESMNHDLSRLLKQKYPRLKESLVLNVREGVNARSQLASVAADYVLDLLADGSVLGVSWGRTICDFANHLRPCRARDVQVMQLSGGFLYESNYMMMPSNLVQMASDKLRCQALYLNMPMFISSCEAKRQLLEDPLNRYALDKARQCQINIVGLSALGSDMTMARVGVISPADARELRDAGAIGDVVGYFINSQGDLVDWSKRDLYGGVDFEVITSAKHVVCLAAEAAKARVLHLALRKEYINTLIITSDLARTLLRMEE